MAEAAQSRVQNAMKDFINNIDRTKLRPVQKAMYLCDAECMSDPSASMEEVIRHSCATSNGDQCDSNSMMIDCIIITCVQAQRCVERCSAPAQKAQQYVQSELEQFQASLGRCVQMCQDEIKDKVRGLMADS